MELLGPASLGIHYCLVVEECAAEFLQFLGAWGDSHQNLLENELDLHFLVVT